MAFLSFFVTSLGYFGTRYLLRYVKSQRFFYGGALASLLSIYTLSDLGVLSNLIGSLSLANEH